MVIYQASAPGKIILLGEHAVVYGQPAIAVPVNQVQATARITQDDDSVPGGRVMATQVGLDSPLTELSENFWGRQLLEHLFARANLTRLPRFTLVIESTIPVAAGLGSGAAVTVAVIRAAARFLQLPLDDKTVNEIAFEIEKVHHGTPSGIDNTVITYNAPVFYIRGQPLQRIEIGAPLTFVIADTGINSPTAVTVGDVRQAWQSEPEQVTPVLNSIGKVVEQGRMAIRQGDYRALGQRMDENQAFLQALTVSSPELETLIDSARAAGAYGAKLSGGGRGGNMIALVEPTSAQSVEKRLQKSGAIRTITTQLGVL